MKEAYNFHTVAAIICHEITHHYLFGRNVRLSDTDENERLTTSRPFIWALDSTCSWVTTIQGRPYEHEWIRWDRYKNSLLFRRVFKAGTNRLCDQENEPA
jgi:hypothetical protein